LDKNKDIKIGLALSGGGYRATLFQLGIVRRLTALGLFPNIKLISSVSGGSILNGLIGLKYDEINGLDDFDKLIYEPLKNMASKNCRNKIIGNKIGSILNKWAAKASPLIPIVNDLSNLEVFQNFLNDKLFNKASLNQLTESARIIINATDLNHGVRFRFDKSDYGGYKTGYCSDTNSVLLSEAVASSAAFPGLFYPNIISTENKEFRLRDWEKNDLGVNLEIPEEMYIADGGIYDNLGIKGIQNELDKAGSDLLVIMCDASRPFITEVDKKSLLAQVRRSNDIISEQNAKDQRNFFMSRVVDKDRKDHIDGVYVGLRNSCNYIKNYTPNPNDDVELLNVNYGLSNAAHKLISQVRTDLNSFTKIEQKALIYHGETTIDLTLRKWRPELYRKLNSVKIEPIGILNDEILEGLKKSHKNMKI